MLIEKGAQVIIAGDTIIANSKDITGTLNVKQRGGTGNTLAKFETTGSLIVGNNGNANVIVENGGNVTSGGATILAAEVDSTAKVTINGDDYRLSWNAGGTAVTPGTYVPPKGNAFLDAQTGIIYVNGLFAMQGDETGSNGLAQFGEGAELRMGNGSFYNMNTSDFADDSLGKIKMNYGSILSGSGNIYAGNSFEMTNGRITPGGRYMYDFDPGSNDKMTGLGTLHITDRGNVITSINGATFQTQLDRGNDLIAAGANKSDHLIVHGDLNTNNNLSINVARILSGDYLLIKTDSDKVISNFNASKLDELGVDSTTLNLNNKTLKGNERIDAIDGSSVSRMYSELRNGNEIWLHIDSLTDGNVATHWTGENGSTWDMVAKNFNASETGGTGQFLDGDKVIFDYSLIDASNRTVNVTNDTKYIGDFKWHTTNANNGNVIVSEVKVSNGSGSDRIVWNGGSIIALDSALYTTLDKGASPANPTPSGQLIKTGEGVLEINNANEFFGGIHLGGSGTTGGKIELKNQYGFGSYNSMSGYQEKGLVYVHEDTTIDVTAINGITNRFIVDNGKLLTFLIDGTFSVTGNNALAGGAINNGKGAGIYIGEAGQVIYQGNGGLKLTNNLGTAGGGIYTVLGYTLQVPADIQGNYASGKGGGVYAEKFFELKDNSAIVGNAAQSAGGGIYVGYLDSFSGISQFNLHGNSVIKNNLSGGQAGGGVFVDAGREFVISTKTESDFSGGDVWFEGNYAGVSFDPDNPVTGHKDISKAFRNAIHLSNKATSGTPSQAASLSIGGPYNTYFYDPISGDTNTQLRINGVIADSGNTEALHNVTPGQMGTTVFHGDSAFYGNTTIADGATFRLESSADAGIITPDNPLGTATFGRRGSLSPNAAVSNIFALDSQSQITGQGKIAADTISLNGIIDLDTGTFSKPADRSGSGTLTDAGTKQGTLYLEGDANFNTSTWNLNLTNNAARTQPKNDLISVTGTASFANGPAGEKLTIDIDKFLRGKYTLLTSSGNIDNFNTNTAMSDAKVYLNGGNINIAPNTGVSTLDTTGRFRVTTYVDNTTQTKTLNLDIAGRNRHVYAIDSGSWGYDDKWAFDAAFIPTGTSGTVQWSKNDAGPETHVFLDGDMVTFSGVGSPYTISIDGTVRPVDVYVE
ncbi:MAG: hypothetical protein ACRC2T_14305, partial [Thermoguttaceae bacterium]